MKNKEKNASKIVEIACKGHDFGVDKNTGKITSCDHTPCIECLFDDNNDRDKVKRAWAESGSEYVERLIISKKDRAFLEYFEEGFEYISRDENGNLFSYKSEPYKSKNFNVLDSSDYSGLDLRYNIEFPMIQWGDHEPWLIEDLKKLEVVEEYE